MLKRHQLTIPGELFQRLFLKLGLITFYVVENFGLKNEERSVDPALGCLGFF